MAALMLLDADNYNRISFLKAQISVNYVENKILSHGTAGAKLSVFCHHRRLKPFCAIFFFFFFFFCSSETFISSSFSLSLFSFCFVCGFLGRSSLTVWLIVIISYPAGMGECSDAGSELRILIWWLNVSLTGPIYNWLIL